MHNQKISVDDLPAVVLCWSYSSCINAFDPCLKKTILISRTFTVDDPQKSSKTGEKTSES